MILILVLIFPFVIPVLLLFNLFWFPRRIAIITSDGNKMGLIKGDLLFKRWNIRRLSSGINDIKVRFNLFNFIPD